MRLMSLRGVFFTTKQSLKDCFALNIGLAMTMVFFSGCRTMATHVDPEARSAVTAISRSFVAEPGDVKYCPVDGTRYSGNLTKCPKCGAALKPVE